MYLFSNFNNNTNAILNSKKDYKKLIYTAEEELNIELDKIKNGNFEADYMETSKVDNMIINKKISVIDKSRGVYIVTVDASFNDRKIRVEGYEQCREYGNIESN